MKNKHFIIAALAASFLLCSESMLAHHGWTTYQPEHVITLKGTVTEFEFINPHALVHLSVKESNGAIETWIATTAPPAMLHKVGWDKTTLKAGDFITVSGYPAKDGSRVLSVLKIVLPNGQQLNQVPR